MSNHIVMVLPKTWEEYEKAMKVLKRGYRIGMFSLQEYDATRYAMKKSVEWEERYAWKHRNDERKKVK